MNLHPLLEVAQTAAKIAANGGQFHQQFVCGSCGQKQTMAEPNKLFTSGVCEQCGHETNIAEAGCNIMALFSRPNTVKGKE